MSSTTSYQSYLPYVFRPVYTYANGVFTTTINLSNINTMSANIASFGQVNIGDSNANVYIGCNAGNSPSNATAFGTSNNSSLGVNSAAGARDVGSSVFLGTFCGANAKNISNCFFAGNFAGYCNLSNDNCVFIGTSNSGTIGKTSNSINIGANSTSVLENSWNVFIGTSNSNSGSSNIMIGSRMSNYGSSNIIIGNGSVSPRSGNNNILIGPSIAPPPYIASDNSVVSIPTNFSNKFFLGSGSNILMAGDFSNNVITIGTTNTNVTTCNASYPNFQIPNISLDVGNYARFEKGISIGCDPGLYQLDVNGQFRASDGYGQIAFSNDLNDSGATNSFVEMKSVYSGGTMTVNVGGQLNVSSNATISGIVTSSGYVTLKGSNQYASVVQYASALTASASGTQITFSNVTTLPAVGSTITTVGFTTSDTGFNGVFKVVSSNVNTVVVSSTLASSTSSTTGKMLAPLAIVPNVARPGLVSIFVMDSTAGNNSYKQDFHVNITGNGSVIAVADNWPYQDSFISISNSVITIAAPTATLAAYPLYYNITVFPTV